MFKFLHKKIKHLTLSKEVKNAAYFADIPVEAAQSIWLAFEEAKVKGRINLGYLSACKKFSLLDPSLSFDLRIQESLVVGVKVAEGRGGSALTQLSDEDLKKEMVEANKALLNMPPGIFGGLGPCLRWKAAYDEQERRKKRQ